jgi:membrane protease YdiL (CAAX protease family)
MMFGPDFQRGKREWLYAARHTQSILLVVLLFGALVAINIIGQNVSAIAGYALLGGKFIKSGGIDPATQALLFKGLVVGLVPASLLAILSTWWFAGFRKQNRVEALALRWPALGWGGWIAVLAGFLIVVYACNAIVFALMGIDPQQYAPSSEGVLDTSSSSGMVEKSMADLADEPLLFALALPGIMVFVPVMEELMFRGVLFTAIAQSPVGRWGAVVTTAALWALMHALSAPWLFVSLIFLMGLLLGVILLRWGSLWLTIACHCLWNTLSSASIFALTGSS